MSHGGARPGAGRKPGSKSKRTQKVAKAAVKSGISPLEYMLQVMRNSRADTKRRDDMAKAAAPFVHPRLATMAHTGPNGGPIQTVDLSKLSDDQLAALEPVLASLAAAGGVAGPGQGGAQEA